MLPMSLRRAATAWLVAPLLLATVVATLPPAVGTRLGATLRRPPADRTPAGKRAAISYAAWSSRPGR